MDKHWTYIESVDNLAKRSQPHQYRQKTILVFKKTAEHPNGTNSHRNEDEMRRKSWKILYKRAAARTAKPNIWTWEGRASPEMRNSQ